MIEQQIFATLKRENFTLYPLVAPLRAKPPFLVYSVISETPSDVLCGQADTPTVIQLDSYAVDPLLAKAEGLKALNHLSNLGLCNMNFSSSFEEETTLYRFQIEFMLIL